MLKVAMLSAWHVHAWGYANEFASRDDVKITCVWDDDIQRGQDWAKDIGCDFEADLDAVLARDDVDAVCCCTATNIHKEVLIKVAKAGKHIFTEKVLASTYAEACEIVEAIEEAGVKFCISYPHRTRADVLFAKKAVDEGWLGKVNYLRIRNAHNGLSANWLPPHFLDPVPTCGGAMMDLGAHGMYIPAFILGNPVKVSSTFNNLIEGCDVEDNAVSVIEFENKAIAVSETGFVTGCSPFQLEVSGTEGTVLFSDDRDGVMIKSNIMEESSGNWIKAELGEGLPSAINQFVDGVLNGGEIVFGTKDALVLSLLMDGAYRSYKEQRAVRFDEIK